MYRAIILLIALAGTSAHAERPRFFVNTASVREIERQVAATDLQPPLAARQRFYAESRIGSMVVINGILLSAGVRATPAGARRVDGVDGAYIVDADKLPRINDGGCAAAEVFYNPRTHRLIPVDSGSGPPRPYACSGRG